MERFEMDVVNACKMIDGDDVDESYYNKIYMSSNESLGNLFLNFDISGKDVLTVLGSSDQLFYSYLNGAKKVDCFDINVLARHYYYLRRWAIDYLGMYYPPDSFLKSHLFSLYQEILSNKIFLQSLNHFYFSIDFDFYFYNFHFSL